MLSLFVSPFYDLILTTGLPYSVFIHDFEKSTQQLYDIGHNVEKYIKVKHATYIEAYWEL